MQSISVLSASSAGGCHRGTGAYRRRLQSRLIPLVDLGHFPPKSACNSALNSKLLVSKETAVQSSRQAGQAQAMGTVQEHSTLSNFEDATVKHSEFEFDVDFDCRVVNGYVKHTVEIKKAGVNELILDTRGLTVTAATAGGEGIHFAYGETQKALGTPLQLALPKDLKAGEEIVVELQFSTAPNSTALQWLEPFQTSGGKYPYLFTQCQAIHARSFVPCQDTPGAKLTYTASVRVPIELTALMSAVPIEAEDPALPDSQHLLKQPRPSCHTFYFNQSVPIATYLLALAVGNLESRELGPISRVWSEPGVVDAAAYEFAETAKFLEAAEAIAGPYVWGRYDLLLLPPSFPYGGMENPCLTFVTPTLLAGDRSLANVVAHEIAHSWTGNLVTNASWEHFWLNEGWTVWLERKILGRISGEQVYQFQASMGFLDLQDEIKSRFGTSHPFTKLVPDLSGGIDPDDAFSRVPYDKGFYFLHYLQGLVGGPEVFENFFRSYVQEFQGMTLTSNDFKTFFLSYFSETVPAVADIDWDTWFYGTGMPPLVNSYDESMATDAYTLAMKWHTLDVMGIGVPQDAPQGCGQDDLKGWSSQQIVAFLEKLAELRSLQPLHPSTTRKMAHLYKLEDSKNSEIRCSWYQLCVKAGDETVLSKVEGFLNEQGRMKYLRPLYRLLYSSKNPQMKEAALATFERSKQAYHPIAVKLVAADLEIEV